MIDKCGSKLQTEELFLIIKKNVKVSRSIKNLGGQRESYLTIFRRPIYQTGMVTNNAATGATVNTIAYGKPDNSVHRYPPKPLTHFCIG